MYICIYVCTLDATDVHAHTYALKCLYTHIHTYEHLTLPIYTHFYNMLLFVRTHIHNHKHTHIHTHTHSHTQTGFYLFKEGL